MRLKTLRTKKTEIKYAKFKANRKNFSGCPLCKEKILKHFKYWRIIRNSFPYDKVAEKHHMIIPIRHTNEKNLNARELKEFKHIKENFINDDGYTFIVETTRQIRTIPEHFHLHLLTLKSIDMKI